MRRLAYVVSWIFLVLLVAIVLIPYVTGIAVRIPLASFGAAALAVALLAFHVRRRWLRPLAIASNAVFCIAAAVLIVGGFDFSVGIVPLAIAAALLLVFCAPAALNVVGLSLDAADRG